MTTTQPVAIPTGEPAQRRTFQLTDLQHNRNKFYVVDTWPLAGEQLVFRATYGRVGTAAQVDTKIATGPWVERKIREKLAKGYQEVRLHQPEVRLTALASAQPIDPKVQALVNAIYAEAGHNIAAFLAVDVGALSLEQVARGRSLLLQAQQQAHAWQHSRSAADFEQLAATVQHFYNAIPTQLAARIDRTQVVDDFCRTLAEQEDRLKQLEAAVATRNACQGQPHLSLLDVLGAEVVLLPENDRCYGDIVDAMLRTTVHGYRVRVRDIFTVTVPAERRAFEQNSIGRSQVALLFHGTPNQNIRHILRSGLRCPRVPAHGRMFGDGIYFASMCSKSANYCRVQRRDVPHMLLLADVAIGRPFVARIAMTDLQTAPAGYDSVWGRAGHTAAWGSALRYDEHIVYHAAQQTLRYLVTFDRT